MAYTISVILYYTIGRGTQYLFLTIQLLIVTLLEIAQHFRSYIFKIQKSSWSAKTMKNKLKNKCQEL